MRDKRFKASQDFYRPSHQVLVQNFGVVLVQCLPELSSGSGSLLADDDFPVVLVQCLPELSSASDEPLPVNRGGNCRAIRIPRQSSDLRQFLPGQRDIPAVPDNMNEQGIGDCLLNPCHVKNVLGRRLCPAAHTLLTTDLLHQNPQKIPAVSAFDHHSGFEKLVINAGTGEEPRLIPGIQHSPFVFLRCQWLKTRLKQGKNMGFHPVNGKVTGGENHVVEKRRSGAAATN